MAQNNSVWGSIVGIFGKKKLDPEKVRLELRRKEREVGEELMRAKREADKLRVEREKAIKKGVKASRNGDTVSKAEAAMELRLARGELNQITNTQFMLMKSRMVVRTMSRKLAVATREGALGLVTSIRDILIDPKLQDMIMDADVSLEDAGDWLTQQTNLLMDDADGKMGAEEDLCGEEGAMFDQLVAAIEKGDSEGAARVNSRLTGEAPIREDLDDDFDI